MIKMEGGKWKMENRKKGFTLVELLLYMGILSILISVLTGIFTASLDVKKESESLSSITQDKTYILSRLAYDIHRAKNINIPGALGGESTNFQIVIDNVNYTYDLDSNGNLTLTNNFGIDNLNSYNSSISGLLVKRLGNVGGVEDALKIRFTITSRSKTSQGYETSKVETNLSLRRK